MAVKIDLQFYHAAARECGFHLSGVAAALPHVDASHYSHWIAAGFAGEMRYLTDHRAQKRADPRTLLPTARTVLSLGMLYNGPQPHTAAFDTYDRAWISRYAWGEDYHHLMRERLQQLAQKLYGVEPFDYKICCDTAPLLERTYARAAGLGWVGRNTCLIHEGQGSWFFLGELITSLDLPPGIPAPDRCGTCQRCIAACPTNAIIPLNGRWAIDSRICISYLTIELRGPIPESHRAGTGSHVFGCDICQDVCPWNRKTPFTTEPAFAPQVYAPSLETMASLTEQEFRSLFQNSPINRARYTGFLRNIATAMGNSNNPAMLPLLHKLAANPDSLVAEHANWAIAQILPATL